MIEAIRRILASKKAIYLMVPTLANAVASVFEFDPTTPIILALDAVFAALFFAQWILDLRWGSKSDGSGTVAGMLLLCAVLASGCTIAVGPEGSWYKGSVWKDFNVEVDFPKSVCLGCLESVVEKRDAGDDRQEE